MANIKYYIIHCDEHIDRVNHINVVKELLNKDICIVKGYYTKNNSLDRNKVIEYLGEIDSNMVLSEFNFNLSGQIGCYVSHHMLVKKIYDDKTNNIDIGDYSVIFEDDVLFKNNLHDNINKIINDLSNDDFDIVFLGSLNKNHGIRKTNNIYYLNEKDWCWGTHALLINNKNIKKIYDNNCNIHHEIDNHYKILIDSKKLNGFVIYPQLCNQNIKFKSNIKI
jgi:GR25 family glycosyltransferase involved in LPS biosynthesis